MFYYTFLTESDVNNELILWLKNRNIQQKFVYVWSWWNKYYEAYWKRDDRDKKDTSEEFTDFLLRNLFPNQDYSSSLALISLWCWNWFWEKRLLENLEKKSLSLEYYGVDFSKEMLNLAVENLSDIWIKKQFIYWDFTSHNFNTEISKLVRKHDKKIYLFFWRTFWNPNQTLITDSLYNLIQNEDYLWMDLMSRVDDSQKTVLKIFNRYKNYLKDEKMLKFMFTPLDILWIPRGSWSFHLETFNEHSLWAIVFSFSFVFSKKVIWEYWWDVFHILPQEKIHLLSIRNYNQEIVEHFMHEHEFILIDKGVEKVNEYMNKLQFMRTVNK